MRAQGAAYLGHARIAYVKLSFEPLRGTRATVATYMVAPVGGKERKIGADGRLPSSED